MIEGAVMILGELWLPGLVFCFELFVWRFIWLVDVFFLLLIFVLVWFLLFVCVVIWRFCGFYFNRFLWFCLIIDFWFDLCDLITQFVYLVTTFGFTFVIVCGYLIYCLWMPWLMIDLFMGFRLFVFGFSIVFGCIGFVLWVCMLLL